MICPTGVPAPTKKRNERGIAMATAVRLVLTGVIGLLASFAWWAERHAAKAADAPAFELMHLWLDPIEAPALAVLRNAAQSAGLRWREHRVEGNFYGVRATFAERLAMQIAPEAVFWIGGASINDLVANGTFRELRNIPNLKRFVDALDPNIASEMVSPNGLSAIPLVVHVQNYMVLNKAVYYQAGLPLPRSWAEFIESAPAIKAKGVIPLSMSNQSWQFRFLFIAILAEQMGPALFKEFHKLEDVARLNPPIRQELINSLKLLDRLRGLTNDDYPDLDWGQVVNRVKTGRAAAAVLGDFMTPLFDNADLYYCNLSFGSNFAIWSNDVLAFPNLRDAARTEVQDRFIDALIEPTRFRQFVERKGGVPVTKEAISPDFNHCTNTEIQFWRSPMPKIHIDANDWSQKFNLLATIAETFWSKRNASAENIADLMIKGAVRPIFRDAPGDGGQSRNK